MSLVLHYAGARVTTGCYVHKAEDDQLNNHPYLFIRVLHEPKFSSPARLSNNNNMCYNNSLLSQLVCGERCHTV